MTLLVGGTLGLQVGVILKFSKKIFNKNSIAKQQSASRGAAALSFVLSDEVVAEEEEEEEEHDEHEQDGAFYRQHRAALLTRASLVRRSELVLRLARLPTLLLRDAIRRTLLRKLCTPEHLGKRACILLFSMLLFVLAYASCVVLFLVNEKHPSRLPLDAVAAGTLPVNTSGVWGVNTTFAPTATPTVAPSTPPPTPLVWRKKTKRPNATHIGNSTISFLAIDSMPAEGAILFFGFALSLVALLGGAAASIFHRSWVVHTVLSGLSLALVLPAACLAASVQAAVREPVVHLRLYRAAMEKFVPAGWTGEQIELWAVEFGGHLARACWLTVVCAIPAPLASTLLFASEEGDGAALLLVAFSTAFALAGVACVACNGIVSVYLDGIGGTVLPWILAALGALAFGASLLGGAGLLLRSKLVLLADGIAIALLLGIALSLSIVGWVLPSTEGEQLKTNWVRNVNQV